MRGAAAKLGLSVSTLYRRVLVVTPGTVARMQH